MKIEMKLLSDAIFGNGQSIPGAEDIAVQCDSSGFPYYKGGTFKGLFRDEFENYLFVCGKSDEEVNSVIRTLFGELGPYASDDRKLTFTDFTLSDAVKKAIIDEIGNGDPMRVTEALTHLRTFTKIDDDGMVADGSLRTARCVDSGLCFYGEITCSEEDKPMVSEALAFVKSIGTMRNRGFGQIRLSIVKEGRA